MPLQYSIEHEAHGNFVTSQRPIVLSLETNESSIAFFRGELLWKNKSDSFVTTGIMFNAYRDMAHQGQYMCNVMEYTRQFFQMNEVFYNSNWCTPGLGSNKYEDSFLQHFAVNFWPVAYGANASLNEMQDDNKTSREFSVLPINTRTFEGYSSENDYIRVDKFVHCGGNNSGLAWPGSAWNETMTNMPDGNEVNVSTPLMWNQILSPCREVNNKIPYIYFTWDGPNAGSYTAISTPYSSNKNGLCNWPMNPSWQSLLANLTGDPSLYDVVNSAGELVNEGINFSVQRKWHNANGSFWRSGHKHTVKLRNETSFCIPPGTDDDTWHTNATQFLFKNMYGGIDWFIARGNHTKAVAVQGNEYAKFTNFDRDRKDFGVWKGQHSRTSLWTQRIDEFSVTTQPLTEEQVIWLEELVSSPLVWIVHNGRDMYDPSYSNAQSLSTTKRLIPVIITPGSYEVFNTDEKLYYMEFKYTLSEPITTQKN